MIAQIQANVLAATFDGAITQDHQLNFDVPVPVGLSAMFGVLRSVLKSIVLVSEQNLSWELWLWGSSTREGANYDADTWLGSWAFLAASATSSADDARYRYFIPDLNIPIVDLDSMAASSLGRLHGSLIPRGAGKTAGTKVVVHFNLQPQNW